MNTAAPAAASPIIRAHAYPAFAAIALGAAQIALPKGSAAHRAMGFGWSALTLAVAGTSMFIHTIRSFGPFSPIHLLPLAAVPVAVHAARARQIRAHARAMRNLYGLALLVTGLFTLRPGRIMHKVVFG